MNVIFFTQSNSLDIFYEVQKRIEKMTSMGKVGYYVANQTHYESFIKNNPDFEKKNSVLKEWEIYREARKHEPSLERINKYQSELGEIDLWTPYVTDRRLSFGKRYAFKQSYKPYFSYEHYLSIMDISLGRIDDLFKSIQPDLICTIYTATFGDCLGHQFAKAKGIRALDLRLSRLKNYVMFVDGVNEPPKHIKKLFFDNEKQLDNKLIIKAKDYINKVKSENALYDGALRASSKKHQFKINAGSFNILALAKKIVKLFLSLINRSDYKNDPQVHNPVIAAFYNLIYKKINNMRNSLALSNKYVSEEYINNNKYIFYPLHVEPELVLAQFARPYLNQIEVIRNIRYSTPLTKTILVKDHPLMFGKRPLSYYKKILSIPNVKLVNPVIPSEKILNNCELLVIIRGAMGLEAVIKGIPVVCLGKTMFELLPKSMYRFCSSLYDLKSEISDLLRNYEFDEKALIKYLISVMDGSCPVNLVTDLLGKKGRYKEGSDTYKFEEHPHLDILSDYLLKRINEA